MTTITPRQMNMVRGRFDGTNQDLEAIWNVGNLLANNFIYPKWKPASEFNTTGIK